VARSKRFGAGGAMQTGVPPLSPVAQGLPRRGARRQPASGRKLLPALHVVAGGPAAQSCCGRPGDVVELVGGRIDSDISLFHQTLNCGELSKTIAVQRYSTQLCKWLYERLLDVQLLVVLIFVVGAIPTGRCTVSHPRKTPLKFSGGQVGTFSGDRVLRLFVETSCALKVVPSFGVVNPAAKQSDGLYVERKDLNLVQTRHRKIPWVPDVLDRGKVQMAMRCEFKYTQISFYLRVWRR